MQVSEPNTVVAAALPDICLGYASKPTVRIDDGEAVQVECKVCGMPPVEVPPKEIGDIAPSPERRCGTRTLATGH